MAKASAAWLADPVVDPMDVEVVQIIIVPAHGDLDDKMQIGQGRGAGESQAPPDQRTDAAERDFDRIELHCWGLSPEKSEVRLPQAKIPGQQHTISRKAREAVWQERLRDPGKAR